MRLPGDDRPIVLAAFDSCLKTSGPETMEYRLKRKDGSWEWIKSTGKVVEHNAAGEPLRMIGIHTDISLQKQNQILLDAERKRFMMLFDASSDGMFIIDMNGQFIDINRTAYERLGYSKAEMLAMQLTELDPPEFAARVPERLALIFSQGSATFETAHYRKDGSVMPVEINARIIELDGQNAFFSVVRDISERKKLEGQLRQSQKMEAIGTLVGGIAHDFNNMLAAIQGNLYLARKQLQDHPIADLKLGNIERLGTQAAEMVHQLLTFARKDSVAMHVFNLNTFMIEGYHLARASIPESIDHQTIICEQALYIKGDATQLQQVLMNLLNNAVDAVENTPQPAIRCSLTAFEATRAFRQKHPQLAGDHFVCICVKDNGSGIPGDRLDKIFEPFFTTKEVGKGTGLGLAMLYGAIQTHGGAVEVESKAGIGTAFRVYLPLSDSVSEPVAKKLIPDMNGHGETILLVDDEESLRSATSEVLKSMGYRVIEASNGDEALTAFKANRDQIDLIISDVIMPRMGGLELMTQVKKLDQTMPVMLITGYDRDHVMNKNLLREGCQLLNKPFNFDILSQTIQAMVK